MPNKFIITRARSQPPCSRCSEVDIFFKALLLEQRLLRAAGRLEVVELEDPDLLRQWETLKTTKTGEVARLVLAKEMRL